MENGDPEGFSIVNFLFKADGNLFEIISALLAIATIWFTYLNYQRKNEIIKLRDEIRHLKKVNLRIDGKVNPESDREVIARAKRSIQIVGTNSLRVLHHSREELISFLKDQGGIIQLLVLDPQSRSFKERVEFEEDHVGRIMSEWSASIHILMGICEKAGQHPRVELRLYDRTPDRSLIIVDALDEPDISSTMIINYYPIKKGTRGYMGGAFVSDYSLVRDRDSFEQNLKFFAKTWASSKPVDPGTACEIE